MMIEMIGTPPRLANGQVIPLAPAIRAGDWIFVSGQLGLDATGAVVGPDIESQTRQCIARLAALLASADANLDQVVKTTVWLSAAEDFPAFNAAYGEAMPARCPARSTVVSTLLIPGAKVEIEALAYAPMT